MHLQDVPEGGLGHIGYQNARGRRCASVAMGPKEMTGPDNATAEMDPLDERRVETHMLCHDHRSLQDPGNGPKAEETPKDFVDSIRYKDVGVLQVQVSRTTSKGTRSRKSQIDGIY